MKHTLKRRLTAAALCLCAIFSTSASFADEPEAWPQEKRIRLVVPFPAGGGADTLARIIAPELSKVLNQTVYIDNRAGAGGSLGTAAALKDKADGYTLIYVTNGTMGTNAALYPRLGYDVAKDFTPVARLTDIVLAMVVNPERIKAKSLNEFLALAQKAQHPMTFASSGNGTTSHLAGILFAQHTGLPFEHIAYPGGAAAMTDILAGRVDFMIDVAPNTMPQVQSQKLVTLGVTSASRVNRWADVPTLSEAGLKSYELFAWDGIVVKAGTDRRIVEKLNEAIQTVLETPAVAQTLAARGAQPQTSTPESFARFIATEHVKWTNLVKQSKTKTAP